MPRSGAAARARLRAAALELYERRGYDATTTAQIAEHAGVTERTYFRHFADKREVLFDGEVELRDTMTAAIAVAPPDRAPLDLVMDAYIAAIPLFVAGRPVAERRARIMAGSSALQERANTKSAAIAQAVIDALVGRGVPEPTARLAVRAGAAAFEHASRAWGGTSAAELGRLIAHATEELRGLSA
ncbi:TetR/AcrR family transcriptional regulator [Gryllotalpicola protaetiae]|uniref:TetR family transcriptional regulator n=1 Tax=Gryllotalpicola protaetiae TaxID=2419771 RepID=A0A387BS64_9MICO|nr:TetR/AcrR family transcriptional regulator [Gryllotalpicola protaetiae]AYG03846.1 TetR family transcriptional regulator [Gryllotalpicola protaetiae]